MVRKTKANNLRQILNFEAVLIVVLIIVVILLVCYLNKKFKLILQERFFSEFPQLISSTLNKFISFMLSGVDIPQII